MTTSSESGLQAFDDHVKMPLLRLPVRSMLYTLGASRVLVSAASTASEERLRGVSPVTDLVAPSHLHTEGTLRAARFHPEARLWGPPGIDKRFADRTWNVLGRDEWPYADTLPFVAVQGMPKVREHVFVHTASKSLFVTDLAFHLDQAEGLGARLILNVFGTYRRFATSRLFMAAVKDRAAFTRSLEELFAHDFDAVWMSHGTPLHADGKAQLRAALAERGIVLRG